MLLVDLYAAGSAICSQPCMHAAAVAQQQFFARERCARPDASRDGAGASSLLRPVFAGGYILKIAGGRAGAPTRTSAPLSSCSAVAYVARAAADAAAIIGAAAFTGRGHRLELHVRPNLARDGLQRPRPDATVLCPGHVGRRLLPSVCGCCYYWWLQSLDVHQQQWLVLLQSCRFGAT